MNEFEGIVGTAPVPVGGTRFEITHRLVHLATEEAIAAVHDWASTDGVILSLCSSDGAVDYPWGTGVLVAPGVAIFATHVIEEMKSQGHFGNGGSIFATGFRGSGLVLWACREFFISEHTDIAIASMEPVSGFTFDAPLHLASLTTRLPKVGDWIQIGGIKAGETSFPKNGDDTAIKVTMSIAGGRVTDVYPTGKPLTPYPIFAADAVALGGHSGAPVFDDRGFLIGIVSTSITGPEGATAFISMLWPAFEHPISVNWPKGFYSNPMTLKRVAGCGASIERADAVALDAETNEIVYASWSL